MKYSFYLIILSLFFTLYSCEDIFEDDITNNTMVVIMPINNLTTSNNKIQFWWEKIHGARSYNIQVVVPDFNAIQQLILDTNVTGEKMTYIFQPGTYQWRMRGENSISYTTWETRNITIDSTSDLSQLTLQLLAPSDNLITNQPVQTYKWSLIGTAEQYNVQIATPQFSGVYTVVLDTIVLNDSLAYVLSEGDYEWRVRAENSTSNTAYSSRFITIDITAPTAPVLISPNLGDTIANPVTLLWNPDNTSIADSLYIYPDSLVSPAAYMGYFTDTTYDYSGTIGEDYFWRIRSFDAAGNKSPYSTVRKFIIQ